jgi:hypothetical protein
VQRGELGRVREPPFQLVVDHHGLAQVAAAVDDPVRDSADAVGRILQQRQRRRRLVRRDERELQGPRPRVDDEDRSGGQ